MKEHYHSTQNTLMLNDENYDSVTAGYVPQDEMRFCRFFLSGFCYKGTISAHLQPMARLASLYPCLGVRCDQLHERPRDRVFTEDKVEVTVELPPARSLTPGTMVPVKITCIVDVYRFYVVVLNWGRLNSGCNRCFTATFETDDTETLDSLQVSFTVVPSV